MTYTIKQVSDMTGIPISTLRFYDKKGLFPFLKRQKNNYRVFTENDISSLQLVECLKKAGIPLNEIKKFTDLVLKGDSTLQQRLEIFYNQEKFVENKIAEMQQALEIIRYKQNYYKKAVELGTEINLLGKDKLPHFEEFCKAINF